MYGVIDCASLEESDRYFENLLNQSSVKGILGFIELRDDEISYIADLISKEVIKSSFENSESLTVSIFLVWMGILYYKDGDFWSHVYDILNISSDKIQLQKCLGEIFLKTVKKYKLIAFKDKLRYIVPILAHGFIPNYYLNDYFSNIVLRIYRERKEAGLNINLDEIRHIVSNWRKEYRLYVEKEDMIRSLNEKEEELLIAKDVFLNYKKLYDLIKLRRLIKKSQDIKDLLQIPDGWLDEKEAERKRLTMKLDELLGIYKRRIDLENKCKELDIQINIIENELFDYFDDTSTNAVLNISFDDVRNLVRNIKNNEKKFLGFIGVIFRIFMHKEYMMMNDNKRRLANMFKNLSIKDDFFKTLDERYIDRLIYLQDLLKKKKIFEATLKEIVETEREAAASISDVSTDNVVTELEKKLEEVNNEIATYKKNLVILGKGRLEDGKEELDKQRNLRNKVKSIKSEIVSYYDVKTLLKNLPLKLKYPNVDEVEKELEKVREKKKRIEDKSKNYTNPLYFINESSRVFICQGGDVADQFIFESLLLIQNLENGKEDTIDILLPPRIKKSMIDWWHESGKALLTDERKRKERETTRVPIHKPLVELDTINRKITVYVPQQSIENCENAIFTLCEDNDKRKELKLNIKKINDKQYCTLPARFNIGPFKYYNFKLSIDDKIFEWKVNGIDDDKFMFFTNEKYLIENLLYLPDDGLYVVAPKECKFIPNEIVKERERMSGDWSSYEFVYIDLEENDAFVIESKGRQYIYKKKININPHLLNGNVIDGVYSEGIMVCNGELPDLVFSAIDDISYYGLRFDYQGNTTFKSLEGLDITWNGSAVLINLSAICHDVYGKCKVSLIYKENVIWTDDIVVLPDLNILFDKKLYPPYESGKRQLGILYLSSKYPLKVLNYADISVKSEGEKIYVEFDTSNEKIDLLLQYFLDTKIDIYISIDIPKIYWRTNNGEKWQSGIGEIWFEDIGDLYIKIPQSIYPKAKLILDDNVQTIVPNVRKGEIIFDLRKLSDSIRSLNKILQDLVISFEDKDISPILICRIRLYWQVKDVTFNAMIYNDRRIIKIKWNDLGRESNRVIRLWPLSEKDRGMIQYNIANGTSQIEISDDIKNLPAGLYRLQFDVDDPWSDDNEVLLPNKDHENCLDVILGDKDEILQDVIKNGLDIIAFDVGGEKIISERKYWIDDIKMYSEFEGEERLTGNIYTFDDNGNIIPVEYNPASFYFILDPKYFTKLPFLIDKDKDGYTYCKRCKVLFSEIAHRECKDNVILPDGIFVNIRRE